MATGKVKWFDVKKGYGVIQMESGKEIFVHHNEIPGREFKSLDEGEMVEFEILKTPKGERAENVVRL